MPKHRPILLFVAALTAALSAQADFVRSSPAADSAVVDRAVPDRAARAAIADCGVSAPGPTWVPAASASLPGSPAPFAAPADELAGSPAAEIRELPPLSDSTALFASALAGLGVWQLGRSARKLHISHLPDWYHANAPQVGHATPLDLEFSLSALPPCQFAAPVAPGDARPSPWWRLRLEERQRPPSQSILLTADPRGPPTSF